jgi:flagellar biosynthesis/type III secretory pathway protein FliH
LTADIAKGLKMMTIDRESVRKMRTGDLARAKRKAASDREHAKQEISKAWQEGVDTGVMEIFREAKEAWQRVINSLEEDIQVIQDELDRRARRRA